MVIDVFRWGTKCCWVFKGCKGTGGVFGGSGGVGRFAMAYPTGLYIKAM